jgi:hypothetical protein
MNNPQPSFASPSSRHAKPKTHHEVVAPRVAGPSGRTL